MSGFLYAVKTKEGTPMTLLDIARIASRYDTKMAHAMLCAVAFAMYDDGCTFPTGEVETDGQP